MTRRRIVTGGLWLAAAAAGALGTRLPRAACPALLAAAAVATAVTLSYEITSVQVDRQGDRITDVILARLDTRDLLASAGDQTAPLRVVRLA